MGYVTPPRVVFRKILFKTLRCVLPKDLLVQFVYTDY